MTKVKPKSKKKSPAVTIDVEYNEVREDIREPKPSCFNNKDEGCDRNLCGSCFDECDSCPSDDVPF